MATVETLQTEVETYEREKASLLANGHQGKFVLIHGNAVAGTWGTFEDALREGYEQFGLKPFLVKEIHPIERIHYLPGAMEL